MTLLRPFALAAILAMILTGPANAADYNQAVDCAAVIKITTQAMPPDYPSAPQVRSLITDWTTFTKAQAYVIGFAPWSSSVLQRSPQHRLI